MLSIETLGSNQTLLRITPTHGAIREILFSYSTAVAAWSSQAGYMVSAVTYSPSTTKHVKAWLKSHNAIAETVPQSTIDALLG